MKNEMQQRSALSDPGRPIGRFRNTAYVINESRTHFDAAHAAGLMAVPGRSMTGRSLPWAPARLMGDLR